MASFVVVPTETIVSMFVRLVLGNLSDTFRKSDDGLCPTISEQVLDLPALVLWIH